VERVVFTARELVTFSASVVTLDAAAWATVERAHIDHPTILTERAPA
jgi:hypothetical protein